MCRPKENGARDICTLFNGLGSMDKILVYVESLRFRAVQADWTKKRATTKTRRLELLKNQTFISF